MNCPEFHYDCDGLCSYRQGDMCNALSQPVSIFDLMTHEELMRYVLEHSKTPEWSVKQWDIVNQLRDEIRGWRQKYNETLNELEKLLKLNKQKLNRKSKWD